ncbi:hypothetical protein [uncultured Flavobacterium sp.]|uniref:hypothetical protein n=1 Tax=uncultured Flavobacterium sp. TaxID=165435 RepID=UPI002596911A|nr:hypothetical protein [uncultured Flavobacterium sp.]
MGKKTYLELLKVLTPTEQKCILEALADRLGDIDDYPPSLPDIVADEVLYLPEGWTKGAEKKAKILIKERANIETFLVTVQANVYIDATNTKDAINKTYEQLENNTFDLSDFEITAEAE